MRHQIRWIVVCCLAMIMSGCQPKVIDPKKDPFVLGTNTMVSVSVEGKIFADLNVAMPLTPVILSIETWVKTIQPVTNQMNLKITLTDNEEYIYKFYKKSSGYLVVIKSPYYDEFHHYLLTDTVYDHIYDYLLENHIPKVPGVYDFVQGMLGKDETTTFDIDATLIGSFLKPDVFSVSSDKDVSRISVLFTLIDTKGNLYHFYQSAGIVEFVSSKDQSVKQYRFEYQDLKDVWNFIKETYPEALKINLLQPVLFTKVYLEGLASFSSSKFIPISQKTSDNLNEILNLQGAYHPDIQTDEQSNCAYVLKDDKGMYYVVCFNPYVVGVGNDPNGTLAYYSLCTQFESGMDIGTYLYSMPIPPPVSNRLDNFTKANAVMHCDCDRHVDFSISQSKYLNNLMDLADHVSITDDSFRMQRYEPTDLFYISTSSNLVLKFYIPLSTNTIILEIDYNGYENAGTTYYRIDDAAYDKVMEAHFYIAGLIDTIKADANPTYDAFYIGDQLSVANLSDLSMTNLTSAQITSIDGLLQRPSWQEISQYDPALSLESKFVLRKDSNSYYIFSQFGSKSVVTYQKNDGDAKVYIIPNKALNDVLNYLKSIK